ncbi:MAG: hypothetical protein EOP47_00785 [Sphingobacteriaceae bacterium]|nr:MAG: hypothetical protein EOP47_00785 [Sphingobacteriaceae bacterium]
MKKLLLMAAGAALLFTACKKANIEPEQPASDDLKVYIVDTVRLNRLNLDGTGSKTIISQAIGNYRSTYIADVSANSPVTKIAYWLRKGNAGAYTSEIHLAAADGSNDKVIKSVTANDFIPGIIKIGNNGLIYFTYTSGTSFVSQFYSIKEDGSAETKVSPSSFTGIKDISADGKLIATVYTSGGKTNLVCMDLSGDGGFGSIKYSENSIAGMLSARIMPDGKKMIGVYTDGTALKCRVVDLVAKTASDVTISTNIPSSIYNFSLSVAPDNDKILLVASGSSVSTTTYIYSISAGKIVQQFSNVNKEVYQGYIF